jgi:hypothetical protein
MLVGACASPRVRLWRRVGPRYPDLDARRDIPLGQAGIVIEVSAMSIEAGNSSV